MKKLVFVVSVSALIDQKIKELGDWRGNILEKERENRHEADTEITGRSAFIAEETAMPCRFAAGYHPDLHRMRHTLCSDCVAISGAKG